MAGRGTDVLLGLAVALVVAAGTAIRQFDGEPAPMLAGSHVALACLLILVGSAALCVRDRYPIPVAVVTLTVSCLYYPLPVPDGPIMLTFVVALYTVAARGRTTAAIVLGGLAMAAAGVGELVAPGRPLGDVGLFLLVGWIVAVIALGRVRRLSVVTRRAEALRSASEERLRIARELHDALGHRLTLINVQAGATLHLARDAPEPTRDALRVIKQSSREALSDLRGTLGVLRELDHRPGVEDLDALVRGVADTGLEARTVVSGSPVPVPAEIGFAAYRIVQEALTNVTRHAAATNVVVAVDYRRDGLHLHVDDDGPADGRLVPGAGITGMRERAAALGGTVAVTHRDAGIRVSARLPWRAR